MSLEKLGIRTAVIVAFVVSIGLVAQTIGQETQHVPAGTNVTSVALLATKNAKLVSAIVDGEKATVFHGIERGHPIFEVQLNILPGQTLEVKFLLDEPTSPGAPRVPVQPLVDHVTPAVSVPECS